MTRRQLDACLRQMLVLGIALVVLLPAARASNPWIGWLPLWLVGMPLAAWWSLRCLQQTTSTPASMRRSRLPARPGRRRRAAMASPAVRRA